MRKGNTNAFHRLMDRGAAEQIPPVFEQNLNYPVLFYG
jgi:hypothetical protein